MATQEGRKFWKERFAQAKEEPTKLFPPAWISLMVFTQVLALFWSAGQVLLSVAFLAVCLIVSFYLTITTSPGHIPETPAWTYDGSPDVDAESVVRPGCRETKKNGGKRHCGWCGLYKPDRTHHCRACRTCILKMDHHSPWVFNCIGQFNYRWFLLTCILYCVLGLTMRWMFTTSDAFDNMGSLNFVESVLLLWKYLETIFIVVLVAGLSTCHSYLAATNATTIEFWEKRMRQAGASPATNDVISWDRGVLANLGEIFFPHNGLSQSRECFQPLRIMGLTGEEIAIFDDVSPDDLVVSLKARLQKETGLAQHEVQLLKGDGGILPDRKTLWESGVSSMTATLTLVVIPTDTETSGTEGSEAHPVAAAIADGRDSTEADESKGHGCNPFANKKLGLPALLLFGVALLFGGMDKLLVRTTLPQWLVAFALLVLLTILPTPLVVWLGKRRTRRPPLAREEVHFRIDAASPLLPS